MSKRAEEKALEIFPVKKVPYYGLSCNAYSERDANLDNRTLFCMGYEQGEKDTTDRAAKWIREHWREYIWGPDADGCIGFGLWENDFRKAMEEE